jgi:hypothetical protein
MYKQLASNDLKKIEIQLLKFDQSWFLELMV